MKAAWSPAAAETTAAVTGAAPLGGPERSDEELLLAYRQTGDRDLFAELVQRYERRLFVFLCRRLGDTELAEDVFQATFLQVHLKCDQFDTRRAFRPWLYTIASRQAIDANRRSERQAAFSLDRACNNRQEDSATFAELLEDHEPGPVDEFRTLQRREWLQRAMGELSPGLRDALQLVYFDDLKYYEAAEVLGVPTGTIKSRVHAAIQKLSELWRRDFNETPYEPA